MSSLGKYIEWLLSTGFFKRNLGHSSTLIPVNHIIKGGTRFTSILSKYRALQIVIIYVLPVNSQLYATAALMTGTVIGFPKSNVNPDTVALLPVFSRILQYFPTTGESTWLSSSVAATHSVFRETT